MIRDWHRSGEASPAHGLQPGGLGGDQADLFEIGGDVRERMLHRLEGSDRAAEGVPVASVLQRLF